MSTYVYAITARSHPALPEGLDGVGNPPQPVRVLEEGELAAVVSDAPEDLRPKRRELLAHQNVLAETGSTGCVLPLRFGSVAPDDSKVTAVLAERANHYEERLKALDGKVEYNLKASHVEEAVLHHVLADSPELRALVQAGRQAGGRSHERQLQLGEMIAAAVQAQEAQDATAVQEALAPYAAATSLGPGSGGWLVNVSFLVERDSAAGFLEKVEELRAAVPHLEMSVNGPLPPYSFVEPGPARPAGTDGTDG
ncbi:GvpL/GvpF family gas vesicle protein [Streptomyces sp. NPDC051963]|uniref:GvpL/GvpF family gas vesicle protein n=1 Tax=Streptomyces sp. NPDC051963 TaxID=3365678 RepID=UPI0037D2608E